ncbi:hypothetical protein D3874_02195 [Oleomonas cavernae]|uniref:Lipoprotein n=1 Tax=Oleomonas cavernae TaxID=2320859 RepID=A0A418WTU8_9PROT|nr:hypothetical protein D3874_02195 [Oleomonas cavernae]
MLAPFAVSAVVLAGCGGKPPPMAATPQSYVVTIDDDVDELAEATKQAQVHCAQFSRGTRLVSVGEIDGKRLVSFECVAN